MGNADAWLLTDPAISTQEQVTEQQFAVKSWSLAQLSEDDRAFILQFQPTIEIRLEAEQKLLCFHGSPNSFDDIILPNTSEEALKGFLGGFDATPLASGHTHTQQLRRFGDDCYFKRLDAPPQSRA
jgi:hypothetical protein